MRSPQSALVCWLAVAALAFLAGCSSGSDDDAAGVGNGGVEPPADVAESLALLGVPTADTPRLSNEGLPLPETFSPFGQRLKVAINADGETRIGAPLEVLVAGFALESATGSFAVLDNLQMPDAGSEIEPQVLAALGAAEAPWVREDHRFEEDAPTTLRDAAAGDLDGDGYEELVTLYVESGVVLARVANLADVTAPVQVMLVPVPPEVLPVGDVRVTTADFDQDGIVEIVAGLSQAAAPGRIVRSALLVLDREAGALVPRHTVQFDATLAAATGASVTMVLAAGNADYDTAHEVVVVLNEFAGTQAIPSQAATRFFVFDDAAQDFALLVADTLGVATTSASYQAQVASVAIGDIDRDMIGEIVFGGLADLTVARSCNYGPNGEPGTLRYLLMVYEFTGSAIHPTHSAYSSNADWNALYPGYCSGSPADRAIRFLDVHVLDFDNDGDADILANQFIFTGIPEQGWNWAQRADFTLPQTVLMPDENTDLVFDRNSARIAIADVDGNGRDDIVTYRGGDDRIRVYSWRQELDVDDFPLPPELYQLASIRVETDDPDLGTIAGLSVNPILLPFDADGLNEGDVQTLEFVRHRFVLSEPIVLAALASPPCVEGIGQNTDACTTSWGTATVSGTESERELTLKAGITVGFEAEFQAGAGFVVDASTKVFGLSIKGTFSEALSRTSSESYEVTRSVSFETGPMEDSVVFTSIPYDIYDYEVIASTHVTMEDIGAEREVHNLGLPRTPVIRMAAVGYYNDHTTEDAVKIDETVFGHTVGRLDSYPDPVRRDEILVARRTQVDAVRTQCNGCWQVDPRMPIVSGNSPARQFDPREALEGLVTETVGVGQGSGSTEVSLDFSVGTSYTTALEKSGELDVEFTKGFFVGGFTLERAVTQGTTTSIGSSASYVGTVGSIGAEYFAAEQYRFGMFTYLQADSESGQEFEVINYWVE